MLHIICHQGNINPNDKEIPITYTPIRMPKIQNTTNTECQRGYEATGSLRVQNGTATVEDSWAVSYTSKHTQHVTQPSRSLGFTQRR